MWFLEQVCGSGVFRWILWHYKPSYCNPPPIQLKQHSVSKRLQDQITPVIYLTFSRLHTKPLYRTSDHSWIIVMLLIIKRVLFQQVMDSEALDIKCCWSYSSSCLQCQYGISTSCVCGLVCHHEPRSGASQLLRMLMMTSPLTITVMMSHRWKGHAGWWIHLWPLPLPAAALWGTQLRWVSAGQTSDVILVKTRREEQFIDWFIDLKWLSGNLIF